MAFARTSTAGTGGAHDHIVDVLIEERAPRLVRTPLWPVLRPALYAALNYREARRMADAIAPLGGDAALDHVSRLLRLDVRTQGIEHIPTRGRCIIAANHPTGIADGIAAYDAIRPVRPDLCFFANADALRVCQGFADVVIPVAWPRETRTMSSSKVTLRMAREALNEERAIVIFPAGELARRIRGRVQDLDWETSVVILARKHEAPLVPLHVSGPFPFLFHAFDRISEELRDITLFHELLNKAEGRYDLTFGAPIAADALGKDPEAATHRLKACVERELAASSASARSGFSSPGEASAR